MQSDPDAVLARRIQKGDDAAFALLVERYQDRLFRLAKGILYNTSGEEDAAQEVFLRAYTGLGRFRFGSTVYTWLFSMLRNICREINRRDARAPLTLDRELRDDLADPSRRVIASERLEQVMQRVREFPDRQRDVVLLRVFEG